MSRHPEVSNPKLVDLAPTWAEYRGWSVIFDRLGPGPRPPGERLDHVPASGEGDLSTLLAGVSDRLRSASASTSIAWLPASTFHVTVMDGLAMSVVERVRGWRRRGLRHRLRSGLGRGDVEALTPGCSAEVAALVNGTAGHPTTFRPGAVCRRGTAVVLELEPLSESIAEFRAVCDLRTTALRALERATGVRLMTTWRPHITLGYFASHDDADRLGETVTIGRGSLPRALLEADVTLASSGVYTFTSMVDFTRTLRGRD